MPMPRFHWHPRARIFAGEKQLDPRAGNAVAAIPATPATAAIEGLCAALASGRGFCVSDQDIPDLAAIPTTHFATLTGGTSGKPKVILRSQSSWIASFEANAAQFGYGLEDSIAVLGGHSHSLALFAVLEGLHLGLSVHILSELKPSRQAARMREDRTTILYATPTQLRLLPSDIFLPHVRLILCGGGALSDETRRHIAALFPNASLHVFYGAAETSFVTLGDPNTPKGSVGRAYPQVDIAIRDPDNTGTGVVWVRSPYLFDGYLHGDSPHTRRDGEWVTVGEFGRIDAQGYLFLRGRAGRVVSVADTTVFPEELEAHFGALGGIGQCVVLARLDTLRGHHLIAVLDGPEDAERRETILEHCRRERLSPLRDVAFLDPFPLLPSGKPDLQRIAALTGCVL